MELNRCPKCAAGVRPGADWCTLCYADLRPAAYAQQATHPGAASVGPLSAAYDELLRLAQPGGAAQQAAAAAGAAKSPAAPTNAHPEGWPCPACRELNVFEAAACHACGTPFGLGLSTPRPSYDRKQVLMWGVAVALLFVLVVGALSFFGAGVEGAKSPKVPVPVGLATSGG